MASILNCGLECGLITMASGSGPHVTTQGSTAATISTTTFRSGLRALRTNTTLSSCYGAITKGISGTVLVFRAYLYITTAPTVSRVIQAGQILGDTVYGLGYNTADSKWYPAYDDNTTVTFGSTGVTLATSTWHRIDYRLNVAANPHLLDVTVNGTALTQLSRAVAATTISSVRLGSSSALSSFDVYHDDFKVSVTSGDYPLGGGYSLSSIPNADGTLNVAGANDFERTLTGTDITNATTTAYQLVDERPLSDTISDFISGIAPSNSTDYVEIAYENSTESAPPVCVEGIALLHDADTAGACAVTVTLRDTNGGTTANIMTGDIGNANINPYRVHFTTIPGTSNAWTLTAFNALVTRFLVSDAAPDPYLDSLMLEAEYADASTPASKPFLQNRWNRWPRR